MLEYDEDRQIISPLKPYKPARSGWSRLTYKEQVAVLEKEFAEFRQESQLHALRRCSEIEDLTERLGLAQTPQSLEEALQRLHEDVVRKHPRMYSEDSYIGEVTALSPFSGVDKGMSDELLSGRETSTALDTYFEQLIEVAAADIAELREREFSLADKKRHLEIQLDHAQKTTTELQERLNNICSPDCSGQSRCYWQSEAERKDIELERLEERVSIFTEERDSLSESFDLLKTRQADSVDECVYNMLLQEKNRQEERREEAENELEGRIRQIASLERCISTLTNDRINLREENARLEEINDNWATQVLATQDALKEAKEIAESRGDRCTERGEIIHRLQVENQKLKDELLGVRTDRDALKRKVKRNRFEDGDFVDYHEIIGGEITSKGHRITHITRIPNDFGHDVAWITNYTGCVPLAALSHSEPESKLGLTHAANPPRS